ncbi:MAG: hypothetical protein Q8R18_00920 [bacterium]|nr:hypothetical protein [bacterium]
MLTERTLEQIEDILFSFPKETMIQAFQREFETRYLGTQNNGKIQWRKPFFTKREDYLDFANMLFTPEENTILKENNAYGCLKSLIQKEIEYFQKEKAISVGDTSCYLVLQPNTINATNKHDLTVHAEGLTILPSTFRERSWLREYATINELKKYSPLSTFIRVEAITMDATRAHVLVMQQTPIFTDEQVMRCAEADILSLFINKPSLEQALAGIYQRKSAILDFREKSLIWSD